MPTTFLVKDALTLKDWSKRFDKRFDNLIDSGLFHVFSDEDRSLYVEGLTTVLKPGGRLFLACFSDEEPGTQGPRRVSKQELRDAFAKGWVIESVEPSPVRPEGLELQRGRAEGVVRGGAAGSLTVRPSRAGASPWRG